MRPTKTKEELVNECLIQIRGVFQHYTDQKIPTENLQELKNALEKNIPEEFTTEYWSAYAIEQEKNRERVLD